MHAKIAELSLELMGTVNAYVSMDTRASIANTLLVNSVQMARFVKTVANRKEIPMELATVSVLNCTEERTVIGLLIA